MQETWVPFRGWEDPLGEGNGNPLPYSPLGNPMDRGAWWARVHGVEKEYDNLTTKQHGRRSLVGCSPWGHEELDTYWATSLSLSCIGEGNGNPLQCSCLENHRDGWAWWAAICGVAQSRTRLKWLHSSSSRTYMAHQLHINLKIHRAYIPTKIVH